MSNPFDDLIPKADGADPGNQANPFADLTPQANAQNAASKDNGAFMAGVDQFNRAFDRVAEGTLALIGTKTFKQKIIDMQKRKEYDADASFKQHPIAGSIGMGLGEGAKWAAYGGPSSLSGGILASAAKTSVQQGLLGYASAPADASGDEKLNNAMNNAAIGATTVGILKGGPMLYNKAAPIAQQAISNPKIQTVYKAIKWGAGLLGVSGGIKNLFN